MGFQNLSIYIYTVFTGLLGMSSVWAAVLPGFWTALLCFSELGGSWIHSGTCYCILVVAASAIFVGPEALLVEQRDFCLQDDVFSVKGDPELWAAQF